MAISVLSRRVLTRSNLPLSRVYYLSTSTVRHSDNSNPAFRQGPAPPRLPEEEQKIFEQLQKQSTGAFSTPRAAPKVNQSPNSEPEPAEVKANSDGEELHPDTRSGLQPEFEGEKNPKTGEVGGPKNEPLRWGAGGDWSYGGRVTDF
ncbi:hypothetical protein BDW59DRAFT_159720 [Aspergillus cavernicola]|uniref:Succinate dehydrogenase assembly factor 4, mitochondrial n=1 Tax=Aspergillus cavernicola TaxID=176166 RepID=A0ABR4IL71_9EURO